MSRYAKYALIGLGLILWCSIPGLLGWPPEAGLLWGLPYGWVAGTYIATLS